MVDEINTILRTIKSGKATGLDKISPEVWKMENLMTDFFNYAMPCINKIKHNKKMDKRLHPPFPEERQPQNHQELHRKNSYCYSY